jgi:hypothetical protein
MPPIFATKFCIITPAGPWCPVDPPRGIATEKVEDALKLINQAMKGLPAQRRRLALQLCRVVLTSQAGSGAVGTRTKLVRNVVHFLLKSNAPSNMFFTHKAIREIGGAFLGGRGKFKQLQRLLKQA